MDVSEVLSVARHCLYLPDGRSAEARYELFETCSASTEAQPGVALSRVKNVFDALTSKTMVALEGNVASQQMESHCAFSTSVSKTMEAMLPEE